MSPVKKYTCLWFGKAQEYLGLPLMPHEAIGQSLKFAVFKWNAFLSVSLHFKVSQM